MKFYDFNEKNSFHDGSVTAYKIKDSNEIAIVLFVFSNDFHSKYYYLMKGNIEFSKVERNSPDFKFGVAQELFAIKYRKKSNDYFVDEMYGNSCVVRVDEVDIIEIDEEAYSKFACLEQEYLPDEVLELFKK
jgi:hypothetical protein